MKQSRYSEPSVPLACSAEARLLAAKAGCLCAPVPSSKSGFSLVEVSLALLVVGIGMLSILSMFPTGLDQNARSIHDTQAALFAQEVFNSLRVCAETNWDGIGKTVGSDPPPPSNKPIPISGSVRWHNPQSLLTMTDNYMYTNVYRIKGNTNLVNHAFRYRIAISTNQALTIKSATLRVWPGQFGSMSDPTIFYTEFYKFNR